MLYVLVLDGPSAQKASPVVATRDPVIVRLVTDAIVARLRPSPISLIKCAASEFDPLRPSGSSEDKERDAGDGQ